MAKFTFAMEPLLKARLAAERQHQREVAAIEAERRAVEESLRRHQLRIAEGRQSLKSGLLGVVDAQGLRQEAAASLHLMRQAQRLVLELHGVHRRLEQARQGLIEAAKARRAIELLREKRWEEWRQAQEKAETAALDELAVMRRAWSGPEA